jgi:hypothetical protein
MAPGSDVRPVTPLPGRGIWRHTGSGIDAYSTLQKAHSITGTLDTYRAAAMAYPFVRSMSAVNVERHTESGVFFPEQQTDACSASVTPNPG